MGGNHYLLTNLLSPEESNIITCIVKYIEKGEGRVPIQQLANENYVSTTFIVKMCKRLGYEGYSELYYHLSQRVSMGQSEGDQSELQTLIDNYDAEKGKQFCELLAQFQSGKIFADGKGFSDLVANYITQRLAVFGFTAYNQLHFYDFMIFHEQNKDITTNIESSLMIAISQSGETEPIINDVRMAKRKDFKVISFTKRANSTLATLSDLTFTVEESKQTLVGGIPNPFFGRVILAFEELMGCYFRQKRT
jgi:DNA-binding MurR/RpiR family transcriptional regulator